MSIALLNGSTEVRVRSSDGVIVLPCGCSHSDVKYLQMCQSHYAEWVALHEAAKAAHGARS